MVNKIPLSGRKIKLLIVSVGSLVGQNILDALEFSEFYRRHHFHIVGTNSLSQTSNIYRCDEGCLVPLTTSEEYPQKIKEILKDVQPDIILTARDADTSVLKEIMTQDNSLPGLLPFGTLNSVNAALNKWKSFTFCRKYNLPFAESFVSGKFEIEKQLTTFIKNVGYPLIAKPIKGFASKNVFFVKDWEDTRYFLGKEGVLFQEYLGKPEDINSYINSLNSPVPLFTEMPNISHHTCHIPIRSDGKIGDIFVLRNHHNFGAVTKLQRVHHPELESLSADFSRAFIKEGGYGPLSVQFRTDKNGLYKAQEMNLRTTGSTHPRLMMGQDEIGYIINDLRPDLKFPVYERSKPIFDSIVVKSLYSYQIQKKDISQLEHSGHWRKKNND